MNILRIAHVEADRHGSVGEVEGAPLLIAEGPPGTGAIGLEARDLDVQEGEITLLPLATPICDEGREDPLVEIGAAGAAIGFTLIPDDSLDGERCSRCDHAVEEGGGRPRIQIGMPMLGQWTARLPGSCFFPFLRLQHGWLVPV